MPHRIEVAIAPHRPDPAGESLRKRLIEDLHIEASAIRVIRVYTIDAALSDEELERVRVELFTDPIIEASASNANIACDFDFLIEVGFRPGVTDNVGHSAAEGVSDTLGRPLAEGEAVYTSWVYAVSGITREQAIALTKGSLANDLIEQWVVLSKEELRAVSSPALLPLPIVTERSNVSVKEVSLELDDAALMRLSQDNTFALELREMQAIRDHYADPQTQAARVALGLPIVPTDIELEIIAQTWSEHCKHKIFAAEIEYTNAKGETKSIDGLFKSYVKATTDVVSQRVDWLVSVFHDNAGLITFDENHLFALKAETHNSPSALDPYGGAMTGIVGVNRDILGAGMGCKCLFNTDVFCFASPFFEGDIPERLLHPRRVLRGVHRGVKDGGNESGIPNLNGAIVFHERFLGKPLVFCGTGGIIPSTVAGKPSHEKAARPGDIIVMVGGRIGKDGIHGATFSSEELHEGSPATAVQIGAPITQKKMADFIIEARDLGLFTCITDNGAGGLSSSLGEMGRDPGGVEIHLDRAPLKYPGLAPWEIFLSEAQERMSLAVAPEKLEAFLALSERREVESTALGTFTNSGRIDCFYEGKLIGSLSMNFLHNGVPRMKLKAQLLPDSSNPKSRIENPKSPSGQGSNLTDSLKSVLSSLNVCSKESFVRMYDHEVQGTSVLKQFQGAANDGPGNAGVMRPVPDSKKGVAIGCGICPKYSDLDCYEMMANAVDEAVRNVVAVGARIGTIAGLDNFCWPDPVESDKTPDGRHKLAQLVRTCEALYDTCVAYDIPLISGKDSMKNDYKIGGTKISIPPTVLFTAAAILDDVAKCVSMDVKRPGDLLYLLGDTHAELGGSEYAALLGQSGGKVPVVRPRLARPLYERLNLAIERGLVASCHDLSDGGLAAALAETAFAGGFGLDVDCSFSELTPEETLFSESASRFVVTIRPENQPAFEAQMAGRPVYLLGKVRADGVLKVGRGRETWIEAGIGELKQAWQAPLRW
jgi:phosphoribosylformylglycinamidine synthase